MGQGWIETQQVSVVYCLFVRISQHPAEAAVQRIVEEVVLAVERVLAVDLNSAALPWLRISEWAVVLEEHHVLFRSEGFQTVSLMEL